MQAQTPSSDSTAVSPPKKPLAGGTKWLLLLRDSPFTFPLVAIIAVMLLVISEVSYRSAVTSLTQLEDMGFVRIRNLELLRLMVDAETGQRGYMLTGREEYLQPYSDSIKELRQLLEPLHIYYEKDPTNAALFEELQTAINRKVSEMQASLTMVKEGKTEGALQLLLTDIGREQMDSIRRLSRKLTEREASKIVTERSEINSTLLLGRIGVGTMTALSMLALMLYLRQRAAIEALRIDQRRSLQQERDQLEALAVERTEQLTELARHLQTAREDERARLARDLHDELGALLTAAKLDVARLKSRIPDISPEAAARMAHLNETLNSGIAMKRRIIEDLRPSSLSNLGLIAALEIQAREFAEASEIKVETHLEKIRLAPSAELTVFRLVQEACTNIAKYAKASEVKIQLLATGDGGVIEVQDNGVGFDTNTQRHPASHGLLGMRFRVEAEGGRMKLESAPGHGTLVSATLPSPPLPDPPA
ncbi:MAG: CHASE3 domain-containing protein [Ideonella sp.]